MRAESGLLQICSFGSNGEGQLGIGHRDDVAKPTPCLFDGEPSAHPQSIAAGGNHTLLLLADGTVWAAGYNKDGRCGLPPREESLLRFHRVTFVGSAGCLVDRFTHVAATVAASTFVTLDNQIYTCGNGEKGELGQGIGVRQTPTAPGMPAPTPQQIYLPKTLESSDPPIDLAAGMSHVVLVLSSGDCFGWGWGRKGQLGEPREDCWTPRKIAGPSRILRAVCGQHFTAIMSALPVENSLDPVSESVDVQRNEIITMLGGEKWGVAAKTPTIIPVPRHVVAGWNSVIVVSKDGHLHGFGRNDFGQLGPRDLSEVRMVVAGTEHILLELDDTERPDYAEKARLVACGWGEHGNTGRVDGGNSTVHSLGTGFVLGAGWGTSWLYLEP